ncbi:sarcosine oxidase subunit gamma family protein [uncultured Roseibium sp.]|uniref:sarcosine oxidase subunit gamma family protein n=1 Tax=uncultured Roseibium sp. TaxID=1936171 RepID=UPI003216AF77
MCKISRSPIAVMVEVVASREAWAGELSQLVADMASGGFVLNLSSERRILRAAHELEGGWEAVTAAGARIVDVSHAWAPFSIEGPWAQDLLTRGIALDLHERAFPTGHAVSTLCGRVPVILHAVGADRFDLYVATSWANWFSDWLEAVRATLIQGRNGPDQRKLRLAG